MMSLINLLLVISVALEVVVSRPCKSGTLCEGTDLCLDGSVDAATREYIIKGRKVFRMSNGFNSDSVVSNSPSQTLNSRALTAFYTNGTSWVIVEGITSDGALTVVDLNLSHYYRLVIVSPSLFHNEPIDSIVEESGNRVVVFIGTKYYTGTFIDGGMEPPFTPDGIYRIKKLIIESDPHEISGRYRYAWNHMDEAVRTSTWVIIFLKNTKHFEFDEPDAGKTDPYPPPAITDD